MDGMSDGGRLAMSIDITAESWEDLFFALVTVESALRRGDYSAICSAPRWSYRHQLAPGATVRCGDQPSHTYDCGCNTRS
jgi:hypothetical protein